MWLTRLVTEFARIPEQLRVALNRLDYLGELIMVSKADVEAALAELELKVESESAQVKDAVSGLESVIADLQEQIKAGVDLSSTLAKVQEISSKVMAIYEPDEDEDEDEEEPEPEDPTIQL
jgi:hypothetical protein